MVDPDSPIDSEYSNEQLNELIKGYMTSKSEANDAWEARKREQVELAVKEGKEGVQDSPIVTLTTIKTLEARIRQYDKEKSQLVESLKEYTERFNSYSDEDCDKAEKEFGEKLKVSTVEQDN